MRRMCGKSLYQEASAVRRTDYGKRVEFAKDRATKIAYGSERLKGQRDQTRAYLFVVPFLPLPRVL